MRLYGSLCVLINPHKFLCILMRRYVSLWVLIGPNAFFFVLIGLLRS